MVLSKLHTLHNRVLTRDVARMLSLSELNPMASAELRGRSPPEAERVLAVGRPVEAANFSHSMHF